MLGASSGGRWLNVENSSMRSNGDKVRDEGGDDKSRGVGVAFA